MSLRVPSPDDPVTMRIEFHLQQALEPLSRFVVTSRQNVADAERILARIEAAVAICRTSKPCLLHRYRSVCVDCGKQREGGKS